MGDPDFCESKCPICTRARQPQPDWNRSFQTPRRASIASSWQPYNQGQGYGISHSGLYNGQQSSDDYMKSNSALPGG